MKRIVVIDRSAGRRWARESAMAVLLVVLVATVFIIPGIRTRWHDTALAADILMTLILISGVAAVADHRKLAIALAILSALIIATGGAGMVRARDQDSGASRLCGVGRVRRVGVCRGYQRVRVRPRDRRPRIRRGRAVPSAGPSVGGRLSRRGDAAPDSFTVHPEGSGFAEWVYFSFVTLTTVGYGDITPVAQGARSLAMLEALVGQLYPAVIIARLVSLQTSSSS